MTINLTLEEINAELNASVETVDENQAPEIPEHLQGVDPLSFLEDEEVLKGLYNAHKLIGVVRTKLMHNRLEESKILRNHNGTKSAYGKALAKGNGDKMSQFHQVSKSEQWQLNILENERRGLEAELQKLEELENKILLAIEALQTEINMNRLKLKAARHQGLNGVPRLEARIEDQIAMIKLLRQ